MTDSNKNKNKALTDFLGYHGNKMSGKERNSFERELQKDPFAEEAAEGFSEIDPEDAIKDISILQKSLEKRVNRRSRIAFYRIAAAVAALMVVSSIFIITREKTRIITVSENIMHEQKIQAPAPIQEQIPLPETKHIERKQVKPAPAPVNDKAEDKSAIINKPEQQTIAQNIAEKEQIISGDSGSAKPEPTTITADDISLRSFASEKKMDMARAAGVQSKGKYEITRNYIPPQPVIGIDSFNIYIKKNIHNPEPENTIQQIVTVIFRVHPDNSVTDITIVSSPGKNYSREAVRLIKEGPAWKPAEEDNIKIVDEVKISIVFNLP
jgi:hypothetical protein